jgi:hypothetical protein
MKKLFFPGLYTIIIVAVFGCSDIQEVQYADFNLLASGQQRETVQLHGINAQEIQLKKNRVIEGKGLEYQMNDGVLALSLQEPNASFRFNPAVTGLPNSWKLYQDLELVFENTGPEKVQTSVVLWAPRGRMPDTVQLIPNAVTAKYIDLHDLPLIGSVTEKYQVTEIEIAFNNQKPAQILLKSMGLVVRKEPKDFVVMDKFGQRASTSWPKKMNHESEFAGHIDHELKNLGQPFDASQFDAYHGIILDHKFPGNGYFSVASKNIGNVKTWFFVTPEGNPFWSFGVTGVRPKKPVNAVTLVKGNEQLFQELPATDGPFASAYIDSTISFYNVNLLKKYGNLAGWRDMTYSRLNSWGLNTIGNWAEDSLLLQSQTPFTYSFETDIKQWNKDVFHPGWEKHIDSVFFRAARWKSNKYLLGYFVDNESGWGNLKLLEQLPEDAFLRKEWKKYLIKKYLDLQSFNPNNTTNYQSWDGLANEKDQSAFAQEDIIALERLYTDRYFRTVATILKKYDPNHLYLGCRFTRKLKPEHILEIAGKYCDVITVNVYSYEPIKEEMEAWHRQTGRPILIGEHQAALKSSRQLPLRWQTFDEAERYAYFTNYVSVWAKMPFSLGSHWYQYSDQHITGRASNGENQIIGFVDITDQPYESMIEASRYNSAHMYQWHGLKSAQSTAKLK